LKADPLVLVIDDEVPIRRLIRTSLLAHNYRCLEADQGRQALELAASHNPDLVLLDLGLPDMDGMEVTSELRNWTHVPIIVISARGQEDDKVRALDTGADDYLTKPFGSRELLARIRASLRHARRDANGKEVSDLTVGNLHIDIARRNVSVAGRDIRLTPNQFKLLSILAKHAGKVLTHRQLLLETWGQAHASESHYLRVYMGQLRNKLEEDPARPQYLLTEHGVGYRLRSDQ
jgi:two-component system, OmpR family, KDP operon response regulator KdpE